MPSQHKESISKLSRRASAAYDKYKSRKAEVRTGGVPNGVTKAGIKDGVAVCTGVRSGVSDDSGAPWFSFNYSAIEESLGAGPGDISGEAFSILYFLGDTDFSTEEDGIAAMVNDLKLLGFDKQVSKGKDLGSALSKIIEDLESNRHFILFNSSSRPNKDRLYRCFVAGVPANYHLPNGAAEETSDKPKASAAGEVLISLNSRVSVEYDGTSYNGTITGINEDDGVVAIDYDDGTSDTVPFEDIQPPVDDDD